MFHRFHKISSLNPFGSLACVTTIHVVIRFSVIRSALHAIIIYLHNRLHGTNCIEQQTWLHVKDAYILCVIHENRGFRESLFDHPIVLKKYTRAYI